MKFLLMVRCCSRYCLCGVVCGCGLFRCSGMVGVRLLKFVFIS